MAAQKLKVGTPLVMPRGLGEAFEVWGNPPQHVRMALHLRKPSEPDELRDVDEAYEDVVVVLSAELGEALPAV
jgi:hypothetical protein